MRKIATLLFAASALAVAAQPAAADTAATYSTSGSPPVITRECVTDYQTGVYGQYGAWGYYIDGCTVRLFCPPSSFTCTARSDTWIRTWSYIGHHVSQNARLRRFDSGGAQVAHRDSSCWGVNYCWPPANSIRIFGGESASVQCNGVRESAGPNGALNRCAITMDSRG